MQIHRRVCEVLAVCLFACGSARSGERAAELESGFRSPSDAAKPWAYWWWIGANVTEASITRDLEEMKRKGIGGLLMFDARGYHDDHTPPPPPRTEFMSPEWRRMLTFAMGEAARLGLKMSVNLSSCAGALRGPWNVGDDAPKQVVWAGAEVQGGKSVACQLPRGEWGRSWDIAVLAVRRDDPGKEAPAAEVIDLTGKADTQGRLVWDAPPGRWTLLRFACEIISGHENDVDILSPAAVEAYFNRMGRAVIEDAGPLTGKTLTHFYSVSWEGAAPTWTVGFEKYFQAARGYDLRPYLPAIAGMTVKNPEVTARFLRDYHKTLGECFMKHCYGTLRELCHRAGLQWHSESGGPWDRKIPGFKDADQFAFLAQNDMPQGEFWVAKNHMMNRPPAIAAHIYGKPLAAVEAFTRMAGHWSESPAMLKPPADTAFCDGANMFIWHTFTASPPEFGKPGIEYFAGTHLNPNVTWWEQSGAFLEYLARCQLMLQKGLFVADVCCYTGDKPYLHWGRGTRWSEQASLELAKGHAFDIVNTEVLLERLSVKDGRLVLPDGMGYRLLVVDIEDETVPPQALRRILDLARQGAKVVLGSRRPTRAPGLTGFPSCDGEVRRLAGELWAPEVIGGRAIGQGRIFTGTPVDEVLRVEGVAPDFEGPWDYTHRRSGDADIYFLSGSGSAECTFRVDGREPELWDPLTGRALDAVCWRASEGGRTKVPLCLPDDGSLFVVFRKPAAAAHVIEAPPCGSGFEIDGRGKTGARVRLWRGGPHAVKLAGDKPVTVDAGNLPAPKEIAGPWEVAFAVGWGAPERTTFDRLLPWNEHPDEGIKYFSGTARYRASFELDEATAKELVRLQLGEVQCIADVRVNGKPLGTVWTAPWAVDLTGVVRAGKNELEIDVSNLWVNRLIGDAGLPEGKRLTKTLVRRDPGFQGKHAALRGYLATDPLARSGLIGPVKLEFGREREVRF